MILSYFVILTSVSAEYLCQEGCSLSFRLSDGVGPLEIALKVGAYQIARVLVEEYGQNPFRTDVYRNAACFLLTGIYLSQFSAYIRRTLL